MFPNENSSLRSSLEQYFVIISALSMAPRSTSPVEDGNTVQQIPDETHGELHFQVFLFAFLLKLVKMN